MNTPIAPAPVVTLDPWEYDHAHHVGIRRSTANWQVADTAAYRNDRKQDERTASPAAAIAELAVAKHLGLYWPATVWVRSAHSRYRHLPDVFPNIEVRRVRDRRNRVAVRAKDLGKGLVLVAAHPIGEEFREVEILGFLPVEEAWEIGTEVPFDSFDSTRGVTVSQMHPMSTWPGSAVA